MNRRCIIISLFLILVFFLMVPVSSSSTETGSQGDLVWSGTVLSIRNVSVHDLIRFVETATVYAEREGKDAALHEFALQNGSFTVAICISGHMILKVLTWLIHGIRNFQARISWILLIRPVFT
jgi:hypothetical protein